MDKPICSVEWCDQPVHARGWCNVHYKRWVRHGDPLAGEPRRYRRSFEEAFWILVDVRGPDDCWPWKGGRNALGYGGFRARVAHKVAYELTVGPVPPGKVLDHFKCDNPPCCNPRHVRPVTNRENVLRSNCVSAVNTAKTHCPKGHPYDEANTYYGHKGKRHCRACQRVRGRARTAR